MKLTTDAHLWKRKWSTWVAALATALTAMSAAFAAAPPEWKVSFPSSLGFWLLIASMVTSALIPVATSLQQKDMP